MKLRSNEEQTAHLQTVLLHYVVRTQIRTAQRDSIQLPSPPQLVRHRIYRVCPLPV